MGAGASSSFGGANFGEYPPKRQEQSVYADPIAIPAPKATDAHRVTGLPDRTNQSYELKEGLRKTCKAESTKTERHDSDNAWKYKY